MLNRVDKLSLLLYWLLYLHLKRQIDNFALRYVIAVGLSETHRTHVHASSFQSLRAPKGREREWVIGSGRRTLPSARDLRSIVRYCSGV